MAHKGRVRYDLKLQSQVREDGSKGEVPDIVFWGGVPYVVIIRSSREHVNGI